MWDDTKKAAWSKAHLFGASACLAPPIPITKLDAVAAHAKELVDLHATSEEKTTLSHEVTVPLVGLVVEVGPASNRTKQVTLLSGWSALQAAKQVGASVPVYPLDDEARDMLITQGCLHPSGVIVDRASAVQVLLDMNRSTAAELLSDESDPIDAEAPAEEEAPA